MSTRATVHFVESGSTKPVAIIYRHWDGYPSGLGEDLKKFINTVNKRVVDKRFNDPAYLAAKWVVFDAQQMSKYTPQKEKTRLAFLSVGIVNQDPCDIEYRYIVTCHFRGKPTITCQKV